MDTGMITCVVHYVIDPAEIEAFERFGARWYDRTFMRPLLPRRDG
jgi:hypothetical protein